MGENQTSRKDPDDPLYLWVKREYVPLFTRRNPLITGYQRETYRRMQQFLNTHSEYDIDRILEATKMYLANTEPKYIRRPYYFIRKRVDGLWVSDLLSWLEKLDEQQRSTSSNLTQRLQ